MANFTQITATHIQNASGTLLASGTLSFQGVDASNRPIAYMAGGGGTVVTTPVTVQITNGAIVGTFFVANPANTSPAGILYTITITDNNLQKVVAQYNLVSFSGDTFNLDNYAPADAAVIPPSGGSVAGSLSVLGNLSITGSILSGQPGAGATTRFGSFLNLKTWTLTHSMGTQAVIALCYDNSFNVIWPDNLQNTDVNTTVATFETPQTGFLVVVNVGTWAPSITNPLNIISNPSSTQTIFGNFPFAFGGDVSIPGKINDIVTVGGTYPTLAAAYAALPSTGGTVQVPANYSETLTADITLNKANAGFQFMGSANIQMGTHSIIVTAGTHGVFFNANVGFGGDHVDVGARFTYSGSGSAFLIGGSSLTTRAFTFNNIAVFTSGANKAISLLNVVYFQMNNFCVGGNSTVGSVGIYTDGTGNFTGTGTIINPVIAFVEKCIFCTGVSMNAVCILGGTLQPGTPNLSFPSAGGIGIDFEQAESNFVYGVDIESAATGVQFGSGAINNYVDFRSESVNTDVNALASSQFNVVHAHRQPPQGNEMVVADAGTNNYFYRAIDGKFRNLTSSAGFTATDGNNQASVTCSADSLDLYPTTNVGGWARAFRVVSLPGSNGQDGAAFGVFGGGTTPNRAYMAIPTASLTGFDSTKIICLMNDGTFTIGGQDAGLSRLGSASLALGNGSAGSFNGSLKLGTTTVSAAAPTVAAGQVGIGSTTATTATAGAQTLPANPAGFLIINVAGTAMKIPYYNT